MANWEEYYADQTSRFLQAQWSRMTLMIIRGWENEIHCMASNTKHKIKWTRILAERRLLKAGGEGLSCVKRCEEIGWEGESRDLSQKAACGVPRHTQVSPTPTIDWVDCRRYSFAD